MASSKNCDGDSFLPVSFCWSPPHGIPRATRSADVTGRVASSSRNASAAANRAYIYGDPGTDQHIIIQAGKGERKGRERESNAK